jgi:hypothetical protein
MKKLIYLLFMALMLSLTTFAQNTQSEKPEMASAMRSNGKIFVVVGVLLLIFAGTITYLILIDRKVSKMESLLNQKAA